MTDDEMTVPAALPPLAPGADDPRSPAAVAVDVAAAPLGPGDDDPRSPARVVPATAPVVPANPDEAFHFLAPTPPGPGDAQTGPRHVVRIPKTPPSSADSLTEQEQE